MISKGVDYYTYLSSGSFGVVYEFPENLGRDVVSIEENTPAQMRAGVREISLSDIGLTEHTGRMKWTASAFGNEIQKKYAEIAPSTGNVGSTDMGNMLQTQSVVSSSPGNSYALSYGFYDAGPGWGTLTNKHQAYVYITDNYSNWMGDLVAAVPSLADKPFATFALPGAHDAGMFDASYLSGLLTRTEVPRDTFAAIGSDIVKLSAPAALRAMINFAFTQKDDITTMLDLGIRYFDFRPGCLLPTIDNTLYHLHTVIPGYGYAAFLEDVLRWLLAHPREIVVVSTNYQGILSDMMKPSADIIDSYLDGALAATNSRESIVPGDKSDLITPIGGLIAAKKRLIFLNQIGRPNDARKCDSYNDSYKTTDVDNIIKALEGVSRSEQAESNYTVLQLQGTASGTVGGMAGSVATISDASSPLLSTKAQFDNHTYAWLKEHVATNFLKDQLIVFLNDFADNALVSTAIDITKQRGKL